jgi:hypothetical protein
MLELILPLLAPYRNLQAPPPSTVRLWGEGGRGFWIDGSWGPAIPYPAVDHGDGNKNHGYCRIKGDENAIRLIPEIQDSPAFTDLLIAINSPGSPIESVGCEKAFSKSEIPNAVTKFGTYTDVIFSDLPLNENIENAASLGCRMLTAVEGCEKWWGDVSMVLQRFRHIPGVKAPWGLMFWINNHGRSEDEAMELWSRTGKRLAQAIAALPNDYR